MPRSAATGRDVTLIAYGNGLWKALAAADTLAGDGIEAEVIDLRVLRPLDTETILASVAKTRRVVIIDEGWRSGSLSAEIGMRIAEDAFFDLDAPLRRVCGREVPMPYAPHLEDAALPQPADIAAAARTYRARQMSDFLMPALGADMEAGTLVEWLVKPGDRVKKGDVVAVVETQKGAIEVEIFDEGIVSELVVPVGTKVPVGGVLARIADGRPTEPPRAAPSTTPAEPRRTAPDIAKSLEPIPVGTGFGRHQSHPGGATARGRTRH